MISVHRSVRGLAALAALTAAQAAAPAAQAQVLAAESFSESFVGALTGPGGPTTQSYDAGVGQIIVNISLGAPSPQTALDLSGVRVAVPETAGARLCVALSTTDGRYSAKSAHRLAEAYAAPPILGLDTKYGDALSAYKAAELLVVARQADDCRADAAGVATPTIAAETTDALLVSVNLGHGRPKAWLEQDGAESTPRARCKKDEKSAKSHDCLVDIAGLAGGRYELVVDSGRLDGPSLIERTALVLP